MDKRIKIRIRMPLPPKEKPPRICAICNETKSGWQFGTPLPVCGLCAQTAYRRPVRGLTTFDGYDYRDERIINVATALIVHMEELANASQKA